MRHKLPLTMSFWQLLSWYSQLHCKDEQNTIFNFIVFTCNKGGFCYVAGAYLAWLQSKIQPFLNNYSLKYVFVDDFGYFADVNC